MRQANSSGGLFTSQERANTSHATLYAFDAETGKDLCSSGDMVSAFAHFSGLAITNGRVFMTAYDCTLYAYGLEP